MLDLAVNAAGLDKADSQPMLGVLEADEHVVATTKRHAKRSVILATTGRLRPKKPATSYWMQRLSKERPDIAARVIAGEISCYRGCIEAGVRKKPAKKWTKPEDYMQPVDA